MASFLRGKQAGVQRDLSAGLEPELFAIDEVARYGINSQTSALAYDPVQSLLALGTKESQCGSGQIYVFGQKRVSVNLSLPRKASVKTLQFCADKLVSVDSKNDVSVYSLESTRIIASYAPPGLVTALLTDPTLDFALIGLQNGVIVAYDLDRQGLASFRIPNLWKDRNPKARLLPVESLAFHPRDIGTLLIGYSEGAVVYSFKQNTPNKFFRYELQPGAPGGDSDPSPAGTLRHPRLTHALWHPTGSYILTGHEDSSLVFWDVKDGRKLMARTIQATNVDQPGATLGSTITSSGTLAVMEPLFRMAWCSKENPDDTGILIAGGLPTTSITKGLTFLDLGPAPVYATSLWPALSQYFESPKRQHTLHSPPSAEVVDFCLIPRKSPHYSGSHDPIALVALLASGELVTLSFPSGHPITPTNQLHVSLTYVHPFVNLISLAHVERSRWLDMLESRQRGPPILRGGAGAKYTIKRFGHRNIVQAGHADGTIRIWDAGHGDDIENQDMLQVDVARAVGRARDVDIAAMSMSGATGELAVGLRTGEVAIFRWARNPNAGKETSHAAGRSFGLESIIDRAEPTVREGLLPLTLLDQQQGPITALKMSDVGFAAIGFEGGSITVVDLRGPAVIYDASISSFSGQGKHGSFRKSNSQSQSRQEWPTSIEFGVMSLEGEDYSSILLFVGTNLGRLVTFKLLPEAHGGYSVTLAGSCTLDDNIISIAPVNADTGEPAGATQDVVAGLRSGSKTNGVLVVITTTSVRIFKPVAAKGAHKTWDAVFCHMAAVVRFEAHGYALLGLFSDGCAKAYSIPGFKQIASSNVSNVLDVRRISEAVITPTGDIFGWTGPSEMAMLNVWGTGDNLTRSLDKIFNPEAIPPPRPTISNLQWISGTQYITPSDMDLLSKALPLSPTSIPYYPMVDLFTKVGGPERPSSKRMLEQMRADEQTQRGAARSISSSSSPAAGARQDEGYWAYMQRQVQERTQNLNVMGDSMDRVEESSARWGDDVSKFVGKAKKKVVMGAVRNTLGF